MEEKQNGILEAAIKGAIIKMSEKGVEGCTTKDIILASFGSLSFNGGLATSEEVRGLTKEVQSCTKKYIAVSISALVSILMVLIFI